MLKRCGRRLLLALAGALLACLLVLTADPPPPPPPAERGRRALRSLAGPAGAARAPGPGEGRSLSEVRSLSEYFGRLTRARRDAGPPPGGAARPPRPPAERLAPRDVFIAVKTTRKFHRARLDLLLDTWVSRHPDMVSPAPGPEGPLPSAARPGGLVPAAAGGVSTPSGPARPCAQRERRPGRGGRGGSPGAQGAAQTCTRRQARACSPGVLLPPGVGVQSGRQHPGFPLGHPPCASLPWGEAFLRGGWGPRRRQGSPGRCCMGWRTGHWDNELAVVWGPGKEPGFGVLSPLHGAEELGGCLTLHAEHPLPPRGTPHAGHRLRARGAGGAVCPGPGRGLAAGRARGLAGHSG